MSAHCLMLSAIIGGKPRRYGACTQTDRDGDHAFASFDGAAFKLIGGTGKYKGISGSGLASVTPEPSLEPGRYGYVMESSTTWTIQPAPPTVDGEVVVHGLSASSPLSNAVRVGVPCQCPGWRRQVFVKSGDDFIRVATNMKDDGWRNGTVLDRKGPR